MPVVRAVTGEVIPARSIPLRPLQSVDVSLGELIPGISGQGQIALSFVGDPMDVVAQVLIVNEAAGLSFNQVLVPRTMCVAPRFEGVFFWPSESAEGIVVLANTSERALDVELQVYGEGTVSARHTFELGPHQTRVMDLREEVLGSSLTGSAALGMSIQQSGRPGDLLVQGWVADPSGYSTNLRLVDAGMRQSERLLSPVLRLGEGARPLLLLANGGDREHEVFLTAHYRINGQAARKRLGRVVVAPKQARALDLEKEVGTIPLRATEVGLELQHRGRGKSVVADLLLVSRDGSGVIQVSPKDARGEAYGGFNYPWRIGEGVETVIAVINPSAVAEVNFGLFLFFGQESYTYEGGRLRPGEVRWVNIKELRDRRIPDQMGRLLPRGVNEGQAKLVVHGIAGEPESQRLIGEAILVDEGRGIRATMACPNCVSQPLRVEPGVVSLTGVVGSRWSLTARVYYADGSSWAINDARAIDWLESNLSVVQVRAIYLGGRDVFEATALAPGTATIDARVNHCWICTPCIDVTLNLTNRIQVTVSGVTISLSPTSVRPDASTTVTVSTNPAVSGQSVSLRAREVANSGGHNHTGRRLGAFASRSGMTDSTGKFQTTYSASSFGGQEIIIATVGGRDYSATLDVLVPGLFELGAGANYDLVGQTATHPSNHWGTAATNSALVNIANEYAALYPGSRLRYNDISLPRGGLFDISANWSTPHIEHREGRNCDVSNSNVPADRRSELERIFNNNRCSFIRESTHWHLRCQ